MQGGQTKLLYPFTSLLLVNFIVLRSNHRHMYTVNIWDSILRAESSLNMLQGYSWRQIYDNK